ncbi:helix-turn-helix transcriptional regulator [Klebsiella variicola]
MEFTITEVFVMGSDLFLSESIRMTIESSTDNRVIIPVRNIEPLEVLKVDNKIRNSRNSNFIVIVPTSYEKFIRFFIPVKNIIVVNSKITPLNFMNIINGKDTLFRQVYRTNNTRLTSIEKKYCLLLSQGLRHRQISQLLQCSEKNVSNIKRRVIQKLDCKNGIEFYKVLITLFSL